MRWPDHAPAPASPTPVDHNGMVGDAAGAAASDSSGTRLYLYPQHQVSVGVLQLLLPVLQLLGPLLLPLQLPDVVHGGLQDGAFVPAHVPLKDAQTGHYLQ